MRTFPIISKAQANVSIVGSNGSTNVVEQAAQYLAAMNYSLYIRDVVTPNKGILIRINKQYLTMHIQSLAGNGGYVDQILLEHTENHNEYTAVMLSLSNDSHWVPEQAVWRYSMNGDVEVPPISEFALS